MCFLNKYGQTICNENCQVILFEEVYKEVNLGKCGQHQACLSIVKFEPKHKTKKLIEKKKLEDVISCLEWIPPHYA